MIDKEKVIEGLRFTMEMFTFNPVTGQDIDPSFLNKDDRITYDACHDAIELLQGSSTNWNEKLVVCDNWRHAITVKKETQDEKAEHIITIDGEPEVQRTDEKDHCDFCINHESGDTLYESTSWDGGIGFDYINNIKYCPICGKRLKDG